MMSKKLGDGGGDGGDEEMKQAFRVFDKDGKWEGDVCVVFVVLCCVVLCYVA
jgi:Ca2+-binding EF-hand superfamily protein